MQDIQRIRYFELIHNGVNTIIYPQLRNVNDSQKDVVWNGKNIKYLLTPGNSIIVDLSAENPPQSTPFCLSCNIVARDDNWETNNVFVYDPTSNIVAVAQEYGAGHLHFLGSRQMDTAVEEERNTFRQATPSLTHAIGLEIQANVPVTGGGIPGASYGVDWEWWRGWIQWALPIPEPIAQALLLIGAALALRGYSFTYSTDGVNTLVYFGRLSVEGDSEKVLTGPDIPVPQQVLNDWDSALRTAAKFHPINKGVVWWNGPRVTGR